MALRIDTSNLVIIQAQSSHVCMNCVKIDYANVPTQNGYKKAVLVLVSLLFLKTASYFYGEQGWHSFETIPLSSIFKSRHRRHFLVEFVVGFLLCYQGFFSGCSCFPQKPTFPIRLGMWICYLLKRYLLFIIIMTPLPSPLQ